MLRFIVIAGEMRGRALRGLPSLRTNVPSRSGIGHGWGSPARQSHSALFPTLVSRKRCGVTVHVVRSAATSVAGSALPVTRFKVMFGAELAVAG